MRILFVTRKFPPSIGGMETAAFELQDALRKSGDKIDLVAWGGSNKWLLVVYPWLFGKALIRAVRHRPDVIYLQDGIMAPLGWGLKFLTRRPTVITIHGLEATHPGRAYRRLVLPFIKRQTILVAVSQGTMRAAIKALGDVPVRVITNGLRDDFYSTRPRPEQLRTIAEETGLPLQKLEQSHLLLTTGRLVKRKGVSWFVDEAMPRIVKENPSVLYLVVGSGPQQSEIEQAISRHALHDNVKLLGKVSDRCLKALYNAVDIFVMPNIFIEHDMEGFGLVAIEAASCGTLVVASNLEGISDAIIDDKNGCLVLPHDAAAYATALNSELIKRTLPASAVRRYTIQHFSWAETAKKYRDIFLTLVP